MKTYLIERVEGIRDHHVGPDRILGHEAVDNLGANEQPRVREGGREGASSLIAASVELNTNIRIFPNLGTSKTQSSASERRASSVEREIRQQATENKSTRTNASISSFVTSRNTNTAPSTGSVSAPAMTIFRCAAISLAP